MTTTNINTGHINDDNNMILSIISQAPPFQQPIGIASGELVVNTDFTSGNDLLFKLPGTTKIRYAHFTGIDGATILYTEADTTAPIGKTFALAARTANVKFIIIFDT